jgi:hypothetical protein
MYVNLANRIIGIFKGKLRGFLSSMMLMIQISCGQQKEVRKMPSLFLHGMSASYSNQNLE